MPTSLSLSHLMRPAVCLAFGISATAAEPPAKPAPTYSEVRYGSHERNVLDFWQAESATPTPFVVFIHGGGFTAGSKNSMQADLLSELLAAKISVVAVNYRYYQQAPLPAALDDCRRALQFVRFKGTEWNLDRLRGAATGGSAGAVVSMYLAFHGDMADPDNDDPVLRESTRLLCVATSAGQTTLDTHWWATQVPGWSGGVINDKHAAARWGVSDPEAYEALIKDASALNLVSRDDPPIWMRYDMAPDSSEPEDPSKKVSWRVHHVAFGVALKHRMDALGLEATLVYPGGSQPPITDELNHHDSIAQFLIAKLRNDRRP